MHRKLHGRTQAIKKKPQPQPQDPSPKGEKKASPPTPLQRARGVEWDLNQGAWNLKLETWFLKLARSALKYSVSLYLVFPQHNVSEIQSFFAFGALLHTFRSPLLWHRFTPHASLFTLLFWVLTEPLLWIQLVAEGSSSKRRALGVAMAKARYHFVEGSPFQ